MQLKRLSLYVLSLLFTEFHFETVLGIAYLILEPKHFLFWVRSSLHLEVFINWSVMVNFVFVQIMAFLFKIIGSHYRVAFSDIFSTIIQIYVKASFCLTYILFVTQNALHQIYNINMRNILFIFVVCWLLKVVFSYLLATKWPYICQTRRAFVWFLFQ